MNVREKYKKQKTKKREKVNGLNSYKRVEEMHTAYENCHMHEIFRFGMCECAFP